MPNLSPPRAFRCRGPLAIFSRPELKTERFTYPVPTPSALRGVVESILWKPAIRWRIERIAVLALVQYSSFRRNEVNYKAIAPAAAVIASGGPAPALFADDSSNRAQRNTVALRDVDYLVHARIEMTDRAGPGDNLTKFVEMFQRRLSRGQCFQQPYFGCRECVADVLAPDDDPNLPTPIDETTDLGLMLWDIDFQSGKKGKPNNTPIFYWAQMNNGVIEVPLTAEDASRSLAAYAKKGAMR